MKYTLKTAVFGRVYHVADGAEKCDFRYRRKDDK
jgi:hypothetical protein